MPSPGGLPNPGIKLGSPALQADSLPTELSEKPVRNGGEDQIHLFLIIHHEITGTNNVNFNLQL